MQCAAGHYWCKRRTIEMALLYLYVRNIAEQQHSFCYSELRLRRSARNTVQTFSIFIYSAASNFNYNVSVGNIYFEYMPF